MRHVAAVAVSFFLITAVASNAKSQVTMDRVVIGSSGGTMSNGDLRMDLTLGQPVIGASQSAALEGDFGFWWLVPNSLLAVNNDQPPVQFALTQSAPNPFSASTAIRYAIPAGQHVPVFIGVFNLQGARVKLLIDSPQDPGVYTLIWNGRGDRGERLSAGVYFVRIQAGPFQRTHKVVLLK